MMNGILKFLEDDRGQDLIEYTLLLAFVSIASVVIFTDAGTSVNTVWKDAKNQLSDAVIASS
jgi:Flp pilus assembly pilin Flp